MVSDEASTSGVADQKANFAKLDLMYKNLRLYVEWTTMPNSAEKVLAMLLPFALSLLGSALADKALKVLNYIKVELVHSNQNGIRLPLQELLEHYASLDANSIMEREFTIVFLRRAYCSASWDVQALQMEELFQLVEKASSKKEAIDLVEMAKCGLKNYYQNVSEDTCKGVDSMEPRPAGCVPFLTRCMHVLLLKTTPEGVLESPSKMSVEQAITLKMGVEDRVEDQAEDYLTCRKLAVLELVDKLNFPGCRVFYPLYYAACTDENPLVRQRAGEKLLRRSTLDGAKVGGWYQPRFTLVTGPLLFAHTNAPWWRAGEKLLRMSTLNGANLEDLADDEGIANAKAFQRTSRGFQPGCTSETDPLLFAYTKAILEARGALRILDILLFDYIFSFQTTVNQRETAMYFASCIIELASEDQIKSMPEYILAALRSIIIASYIFATFDEDGMEICNSELLKFAYLAICGIALRSSDLISKNLFDVGLVFDVLRADQPESIRRTVQQSLFLLALGYNANLEVDTEVEDLLLEIVKASESEEARFCSVLWAIKLYPSSHALSRLICMMGAADTKLETRLMARQGLEPKSEEERSTTDPDCPDMKSMMQCICRHEPKVLSKPLIGECSQQLFRSETYVAMIPYVQRCYERENVGACNEMVAADTSPEEAFQLLLEHAMAADGPADLHALASTTLLKLASSNQVVLGRIGIQWVLQFIGHSDSRTREAMACLLGMVVNSGLSSQQEVVGRLLSPFHSVQRARFEELLGSICAIGYVLAQTHDFPEYSSLMYKALHALFEHSKGTDHPSLVGSAAEAIGRLGLRKPLPVTTGDLASLAATTSSSNSDAASCSSAKTAIQATTGCRVPEEREATKFLADEGKELSLASIVKQLTALLASKDVSIQRKAATALGHLCFGNRSSQDLSNAALTALFTLSKSNSEDVLFSAGEAMAFIWGGLQVKADDILKSNYVSLAASSTSESLVRRTQGASNMSIADQSTDDMQSETARNRIVEKLHELLGSDLPDDRYSGTIWLLSILSLCWHHPRVQVMLRPQILPVLDRLQLDSQPLTRARARDGMNIVHNLGDEATRNEAFKILQRTNSILRDCIVQERGDKVCCVCLENCIGAIFTPCGHPFCLPCAQKLRRGEGTEAAFSRPRCPRCRQDIVDMNQIRW